MRHMAYDPFDDEFFKRMWRILREFERGDFDREFREMQKKFNIDLHDLKRMPGLTGFKIEIRDHGTGKPEVKVTKLGKQPQELAPVEARAVEEFKPRTKQKEIKPITRMLETNCGKVERMDEVVLTMQIPGVRKEDVEIRQLENTLEIIARKPSGEAYFGAFELPPDVAFGEREIEFRGEMLVLSIPRRRAYSRRS